MDSSTVAALIAAIAAVVAAVVPNLILLRKSKLERAYVVEDRKDEDKILIKLMNEKLDEKFTSVNTRLDDLQSSVNDNIETVNSKIDNIKTGFTKNLSELDFKILFNDVMQRRLRILRFEEDVIHNKLMTKDSYESILEDIDVYNAFHTAHPDIKNGRCVTAAKIINEDYENRMKNNNFLL